MEYRSCFILMPFSKTNELEKVDLDYIYSHILKRAVEEFEFEGKKYFQLVERFESRVGSIISGIVNNLNTAELVIADLTGLNANVMYELGVRHTLKRGTIIVSQSLDNLPSDLRDYLTVEYTYSQKTTEQVVNYENFKINLHKSITEVITTNKYDSPVLSYLMQKKRFKDEADIERLQDNAIIIKALHDECMKIREMIISLKDKNYEGADNLLTFQLFNLVFNNLTTALSEINIPYSSSVLYHQIINARTLLGEINKMFGVNEYFDTFKGIADFPSGVFGTTSIEGCMERPFVNVFAISKGDELKFINTFDLFKKEGYLENELLSNLREYIKKKAVELGIDKEEIVQILNY